MTDSNRNLAAKVLQLLGDIARAMGPVSCSVAGQLGVLCACILRASTRLGAWAAGCMLHHLALSHNG